MTTTSNIGIYDLTGENNNPLTNTPYSSDYKNNVKYWKDLPCYKHRDKLITLINKNQVILIVSGTGSGKTVLIPKFALHTLNYKKTVLVTTPKTITTQENAKWAATLLDVTLGKEVGYRFKGSDPNHVSDDSKLIFSTDGLILSDMMNTDELLSNIDILIIDEAHERNLNIDLLLFKAKKILYNRPEFKLIIMSATINAEIFEKYYTKEYDGVSFTFDKYEIEGASYKPVKSIFLSSPIKKSEVMFKAIEIITELVNQDFQGDILAFLSTKSEILKLQDKLQKTQFKNKQYIVGIYSKVEDEDMKNALDDQLCINDTELCSVKVILTTNIAESSITIKGLYYVIDNGYQWFVNFDSEQFCSVMGQERITQASIKQRMGRVGRTKDGVCYHLYTEKEYKTFPKFPPGKIFVENISNFAAKFILVEKSPSAFVDIINNLIEPIKEKSIINYLYYLYISGVLVSSEKLTMGFITLIENSTKNKSLDKLLKVSDLAEKIVGFRLLNTEDILCIYYAHQNNCVEPMCRILALMIACNNNINDLFHKHYDELDIFKQSLNPLSNHLTLMELFKHKDIDGLFAYSIKPKIDKEYNDLIKLYETNKELLGRTSPVFDNDADNVILSLALGRLFFFCKKQNEIFIPSFQPIKSIYGLSRFAQLCTDYTDYCVTSGFTQGDWGNELNMITFIAPYILSKVKSLISIDFYHFLTMNYDS